MLIGLDLFTGIGGMSIALAPWVKPIAYCENNPYCQAVLVSKMSEKEIPIAPIWDDVQTLHRGEIPPTPIDIIYGGFPCQDISIAGTGKGLDGKRSGLFFEVIRLCSELRPHFIFMENVSAISFRGGREVITQVTSLGYDCRWLTIPSGHGLKGFRGNRWFLLAKAKKQGLQELGWRETITGSSLNVQKTRMDRFDIEVKPGICRAADGLSNRVDRIKCLGNSIPPIAQAQKAFKLLMGLEAFNGYDSP